VTENKTRNAESSRSERLRLALKRLASAVQLRPWGAEIYMALTSGGA
jgi:hypothetical protein